MKIKSYHDAGSWNEAEMLLAKVSLWDGEIRVIASSEINMGPPPGFAIALMNRHGFRVYQFGVN